MTAVVDLAGELLLAQRCSQLVLEEAELLDQRRLDDWTRLFTDDAFYWWPMDGTQVAPGDGLNIVYDDRARLLDRVSRLRSGLAFSDEPNSVTNHVLSAVQVLGGERADALRGGRPAAPGEHVVTARGIVGRTRQGKTDTFHARFAWILRESGDTFGIVMKRVDLLNAKDPLPVLTFLL